MLTELENGIGRLYELFGNAKRINYSLVPKPYREWLKGRPDILEGKYSYDPERVSFRAVPREICAIYSYLHKMKEDYPEYGELMERILKNPFSSEREEGVAGVTIIGRRTLSPMDDACRVAVIIPAKDEEDSIYPTLESYSNQQTKTDESLDPRLYELNILVNTSNGEEFDRTYDNILCFKRDHPNVRVNALEVQFSERWACVGMARKLISDLVLMRALERGSYRNPLYLQSDDADLIWVDPRQIWTVIDTFDNQQHLDVLIGYQEKFLRYIANIDFVFLSRRFWDLMTAQAFHYLLKGKISPEKRDFHWSRPFTYGTNTAITAEAFALIGGYDWDAKVAEDLDLGKRLSLLRGKVIDGVFTPELRTLGLMRTRTNSSPRRYLECLITDIGNPYSEANFQRREVRQVPLDEMTRRIPTKYRRLTEATKGIYEKELWFLYETTRKIIPDPNLAKLIVRRTLVLMGFCPQDFEVTDTEIHILNVDNFARALEEYRSQKGIGIPNDPLSKNGS